MFKKKILQIIGNKDHQQCLRNSGGAVNSSEEFGHLFWEKYN